MNAFFRLIEQIGRVKSLISLFELKNVVCDIDIYTTNTNNALRLKWSAPWPDKLRRQSEMAAIEHILSSKELEDFDDSLTDHELLFLNAWKRETEWINYKMRFEKPEDYTVYLGDLGYNEWDVLESSLEPYISEKGRKTINTYKEGLN